MHGVEAKLENTLEVSEFPYVLLEELLKLTSEIEIYFCNDLVLRT